MSTFRSLLHDANILKRLDSLGYKEPTPIQEAAIPHILDGTDLMALPLLFLKREGFFLGDRVLVTAPPPYDKREAVFTIGWEIVWSEFRRLASRS